MSRSKSPRRRTLAEVEAEAKRLRAYQEAFFALYAGEKPVRYASGEGDMKCVADTLALARPSGGVVIVGESSVFYAEEWLAETTEHVSPHVRAVAALIKSACERARS